MMIAGKTVAHWLSNTLVIRLHAPAQAATVFERLRAMGFAVEALPQIGLSDLLAISATTKGQLMFYFVGLDTPRALPDDLTLLAEDFLLFPLRESQQLVQANLQRKAREVKAAAQLSALGRVDPSTLTETQLADIEQLYFKCKA